MLYEVEKERLRDGVRVKKERKKPITYDMACDCPTYFLCVTQAAIICDNLISYYYYYSLKHQPTRKLLL